MVGFKIRSCFEEALPQITLWRVRSPNLRRRRMIKDIIQKITEGHAEFGKLIPLRDIMNTRKLENSRQLTVFGKAPRIFR
jgi:hypothetical protein